MTSSNPGDERRDVSLLGYFHTGCGVLALLLGAWIILTEKGTRRHILAGWAYVVCMAFLNLSSLCLYNLTGSFNVFHFLAILSLVMVGIGISQVVRRRSRWLWRHYQYMTWSYVGLLAATCNEAFVRVPPLQHLTERNGQSLPLLAMTAIVVLSGVVIFAMQERVLARYKRVGDIAQNAR